MFATDTPAAAALALHEEGVRKVEALNARRSTEPRKPRSTRKRDASGRFLPTSPYYVRRGC